MLTNPNTLGKFEKNILGIAQLIHGVGGLMYCDGANLNGMLVGQDQGIWDSTLFT